MQYKCKADQVVLASVVMAGWLRGYANAYIGLGSGAWTGRALLPRTQSCVPACGGNLCMMASKKKKKGGAAGAALAALEELEAKEAGLVPEVPEVVSKHPKKDKKNKKGPAGAALAALEELEAMEAMFDEDDAAPLPVGKKKKPKKDKKKKKGKEAPVANNVAAAAAAMMEAEKATEAAGADPVAEAGVEVPVEVPPQKEETLEEKMRKSRPPPRVRISESAQPGYVSLRLQDVAVTFRNQEVLTDATWEVKTGDRIGLVGPNGGGKTTQMKILAGELEATAGEVIKSSKDLRVAFLRQEFVDELVPERPLKEEFMSVFTAEAAVIKALEEAEEALSNTDVQNDPEAMEKALNSLASAQEEAERLKVFSLSTKVEKVMDLMGFLPEDGEALVGSFSGGWRMRIGLGKILLQDPNILLLDEPTNHLDLESVEWLEAFLQNQNIPMVIVSHDREFLDRVCTKIVETDGGVASTYDGNYSRYLKLRKARMDAWQSAYEAQQKKIRDDKVWINQYKNKGGAFSAQIKSREKAIERLMSSDDFVKKPPHAGKPFVFRFPDPPRASEEIVRVEQASHGYNGRKLFENSDLMVETGQRIAILGPNGAGKSTLLRLIMGIEEPEKGSASLGRGVVANYFEQNQADALDLNKTVMRTIEDVSTTQSYNELRKLLGQFKMKGDDVEKQIWQLSGGEKARVSLCCMMLKPANLLVLDEPTNHLDIPAKEMLEEALQHYDGAVVVVSHDRYFVSQVANTICCLEDGQINRYEGDYSYYMDQNDKLLMKAEARYVEGVEGIRSAPVIDLQEIKSSKKSFGGKGGPSGRKDKGVKNAKREFMLTETVTVLTLPYTNGGFRIDLLLLALIPEGRLMCHDN
ncbi:unnamed protein product [Chrysoparadoxa australica]